MFTIESDKTINITRGDNAEICIRALDMINNKGEKLSGFHPGEVIRLKVFEKKACENVVLQKDFSIEEETESLSLMLTEYDTRFGDVISKPVDYWYEIELNPYTEPQTIVGYDEDGAKIFRLYPEGKDVEFIPPTEEEIGTVDKELDLTSQRPIQNQAVARAVIKLSATVKDNGEKLDTASTDISSLKTKVDNLLSLPEGSTTADAELYDIRLGADGTVYGSAGEAVRSQTSKLRTELEGAIGVVEAEPEYFYGLVEYEDCFYSKNAEDYADGDGRIFEYGLATSLAPVTEGQKFFVSGMCQNGSCLIAEFDENKNFIKGVCTEDYIYVTDYEYTVPNGVSFVAFSTSARNMAFDIKVPSTKSWMFRKVGEELDALNAGAETQKNKVTTIDLNSTDEQYPSAKAVYDFFNGMLVLSSDYFQNGSLVSGSDIAYAIVLKKLIPVSSGDLIKVAPGNGYKVWYKLVNSEDLSVALNIYNGGNTAEEREYTATQDGWLAVQVSRVNGTKITPDDYCCDISITNRKDDMEILTEVDIEAEHSNNQVYGAAAMDEALLEIGEILGEKKSSSEDSVDALFSKHTPFTHIVDNCQDITKWTVTNTSSELAQVDATNCILGTQSLRSNNSMRSTANSYDLTNNYLVLKLRINIIGKGSRLLLNICNKNTPSIRATYELGRGTSWTTPEGWQEIIISSDNYSSITGDVDFSNVDDVYFYTSVLAGTDTAEVDWNLQYVGTRPKATNKGIVTFTFDDGWDTQYTGVKLLAEKGITSTIFCIKEAVESGNYLTLEALKKLVNYYGTDVEVHGDPAYDQWDEEELKKHWSESQQFLKENGLGEGKHMAYPNGMFPENVVELAKDYFDSCRTIIPFVPIETLPVADRYRIRAVSGVGEANVKAKTVKQYIDRVAKDGGWLILVLHKIGDNANDSMYCSENDLAAIADYAIDSGVDIMNYAEVMERCYAGLSPRKDIVNETTVVTPKNKVFERIATVTVSPDESGNLPTSIIIDKDDNGNAFELTDIYCDVIIGMTAGKSGRFYIQAGTPVGSKTLSLWGNGNIDLRDGALRKWCFRYDSFGEGNGGLMTAPSATLALTVGLPSANVSNLFGQPVPVGKTLDITEVRFIGQIGEPLTFMEGTTITLWGVRK